jgi:hypothetical protein
MKLFILTILSILALSIFAIIITKSVLINQNCTGYLERAANANTVETAKDELKKAIDYLQANNLTKGYTSILWKTPDEDIEFWYKNLKESYGELMKVDSKTSSFEKTNLLMKLRETLIDNSSKGDNITVPKGISRHPNNLIWGILILFSSLIIIFLILLIGLEL